MKEAANVDVSEIEVTPEMIEAGVRAFYVRDWGEEPGEWAVVRIYLAMEASRAGAVKLSASSGKFLSRSGIEAG